MVKKNLSDYDLLTVYVNFLNLFFIVLFYFIILFLYFIETLEREMEKVEKSAIDKVWPLQSLGVKQAVKAISSLLGSIETLDMSHALDIFVNACSQLQVSHVCFNNFYIVIIILIDLLYFVIFKFCFMYQNYID